MAADVPAQEEQGFEQSLVGLEQVVDRLERGELGLEDSLRHYELGHRALRRCYQLLEDARRKIEVLTGSPVPGEPSAWRPLDAADFPSGAGDRMNLGAAPGESNVEGGSR